MENVQSDSRGNKLNKDRKSIEVEGKTVEDAIQKALKLLSAPRDSVQVKIVCEEKKGLFGMDGAKPAKVVVTLKKENS